MTVISCNQCTCPLHNFMALCRCLLCCRGLAAYTCRTRADSHIISFSLSQAFFRISLLSLFQFVTFSFSPHHLFCFPFMSPKKNNTNIGPTVSCLGAEKAPQVADWNAASNWRISILIVESQASRLRPTSSILWEYKTRYTNTSDARLFDAMFWREPIHLCNTVETFVEMRRSALGIRDEKFCVDVARYAGGCVQIQHTKHSPCWKGW